MPSLILSSLTVSQLIKDFYREKFKKPMADFNSTHDLGKDYGFDSLEILELQNYIISRLEEELKSQKFSEEASIYKINIEMPDDLPITLNIGELQIAVSKAYTSYGMWIS